MTSSFVLRDELWSEGPTGEVGRLVSNRSGLTLHPEEARRPNARSAVAKAATVSHPPTTLASLSASGVPSERALLRLAG
jgi:hypothetical protein